MPVAEDLVGTFACEAKNGAGTGEMCTVSVNNPVAALAGVDGSNGQANGAVENSYAYIAFGGGAVTVIVFVFALVSILFCRKRYGFTATKYNLENIRRSPGGRSMDETVGLDGSKPTSALIDPSANTHPRSNLRNAGGRSPAPGKRDAYKLYRL